MLKVERHNYEEYFLLYVDNELNAEQRLAVENFIAQNEDLRPAFEMLQQATLPLVDIHFNQKDSLLKKETGISINNYETYFLLSVDNELNNTEKASVEKFVLQHPKLQDEFTLLHKTKLKPEAIIFNNKKALLRKERRVVSMLWMRMSVAAAVIGIVAFSWFALNDDNNLMTAPVAINNPTVNPKEANKIQKNNEQTVTRNIVDPLQSKAAVLKVKNKSNPTTKFVETKSPLHKQDQIEYLVRQKNENIPQPIVPDNNITVATNKNETSIIPLPNTIGTPGANNKINSTSVAIAASNQLSVEQPVIASQAVYKEVINTDEEDKSVYIGNLQINKNKIKSLFKKASGIFGKRREKDPTEKSVQVAGFEIRTT